VTREQLNTLIINLYPGNKGYSLAFRSPNITPKQIDRENIHETPSWLYDNAHLLDALDAEELPPLLIDFCNVHCPHLYYSGAVIAQVRDYRQSYPMDICDIHYVLLRSTSAAHLDEINSADDGSWSVKERTALESQLVLATAPPICLDPSPSIGFAAINATTECAPFTYDGVRKMAKKFLQVTKNRNNKLEKKTLYPEAALANHIAMERRGARRDLAKAIRAPRLPQISLDGTEAIVLSNIKNLPIVQPSTRYDWQPRNTERLTFETDRDNCQYRVRVELFERAPTCEVSGQLTLERQKGGSGQSSGRMCPFKLSSPLAARRYVKEFMGIFTEEGRKFVKITHERETKAGIEKMEMQTGEKVGSIQPPKIQTIPTPSTSITSPPPPPALVATPTLKLSAPQRIITTRPSPGQQVVVLAQVKQESNGNQVIKNLLNQPRAPMTQTMVNGLNPPEVQTLYLQVDQSNIIHMGSAVPANLQVQSVILN
jgi:transcription factor SPT20 homolog